MRISFQFKPFSKKQRKVLNWWTPNSPVKDKDGIIADGSIRSGKTVSMSLSFVIWAMSTFSGQNFGMCGKTIGSFRRNVLMWLKIMLISRGYSVEDHRADNLIVVKRGDVYNNFYIFGGKDERSQDLIQGVTLAGVFFDEVALMPESFVNQATGRCSVDGSKYWFNCNPDGPYHWFKTNWIDKAKEKDLIYLHFTMDDNLSLSERVKERYKKLYSGVFFKRYILGFWVMAEGVIYDMFSPERHVVDCEAIAAEYRAKYGREFWNGERYVSCDYGTQNATAFLLCERAANNKYYCRKLYYYSGRDKGIQKTDAEYSADLTAWLGGIEIRKVILDPAAASFKAQLEKDGYKVKKAKNDVLDGIRFLASLLSTDSLFIDKSCVDLIKEFGAYTWDLKAAERGEDKPVKQNDHCLTGNTLVDTVDGQIPIKDLVGKKGKVYCFDRLKRKKTVSDFFDVRLTQKNALIYEITLKDGTSIKATAEHKVLTKNGWKKVIDLSLNDEIVRVI